MMLERTTAKNESRDKKLFRNQVKDFFCKRTLKVIYNNTEKNY